MQTLVCIRCNSNSILVEDHQGMHAKKATCSRCGYSWWPAKDPSQKRRRNSHRDLVERFDGRFCSICFRAREDLNPGETLEGHHVIEHQHGGSSERDNIWILCTNCHDLVHWIRKLLGRTHPRNLPVSVPKPSVPEPSNEPEVIDGWVFGAER